MNKNVTKYLLVGDKFMPKLHLRQPGFTYNACRPLTKHCERIQKLRETGSLKHPYKMNKMSFFFLMMQFILIKKISLKELF